MLFEDLVEANAGRSPEEMAFIETRFVRRTGMLPAALSDSLIGGMLSEDPAAQVAAAIRLVAFKISFPHSPAKPLEPKFATFWDVTYPGRDLAGT